MKLSQLKLARMVGVSQQAIGQWENKHAERPKKLEELSQALKCSTDWLLGGSEKPSKPTKGIPLISHVQAGALAEAIDNHAPRDADDWIDYDGKNLSGKMIALKVKGSSMNRVSPEGSVVIIDLQQRELMPNQLYVVKIGYDNEVTYKRYRATPPRLEPDSTDNHDTIFLNGDKPVYPIGRVVRTMLDFE